MITFDIEVLGKNYPISLSNNDILELIDDGHLINLIEKGVIDLANNGSELVLVKLLNISNFIKNKVHEKENINRPD